MKQTIKIAVSVTNVNTEEREVEVLTEEKYFQRFDEGRFFPRGEILFAIIPRSKTTGWYTIMQVERNKQDYNDFVPSKDCRQEYWLGDGEQLRKTAFDLIQGKEYGWTEMTKELFEERRNDLLNKYKVEA